MLATALRGNAADGALDYLEERLLHALAADVARYRDVVRLRGDLVYLIDVDDAALGQLHIAVGVLQEVPHEVLHVLAHIARLRKNRRVAYRERNAQHLGERLCKERLAAPRWAYEQDVRLLYLHVVEPADEARRRGLPARPLRAVRRLLRLDAAVVVVHRDCKRLLRRLLPDYVLVEELLYLPGGRHRPELWRLARHGLLAAYNPVVYELHAVHADVPLAAGDDRHLVGRAPAE